MKDNKIIAEFIGLVYYPKGNSKEVSSGWWREPSNSLGFKITNGKKGGPHKVCRHHHELKYDSSWDWLMPVVEKIDEYHPLQDISINGNRAVFIDYTVKGDLFSEWYQEGTKIQCTYKAVVEFIKWYNKNNNDTKTYRRY